MRSFLAAAVVATCAAVAPGRASDATNAVPRNLAIEVTVIRFKPESKDQILQDHRFSGTATNVVEALRAAGRSVDIVYRGTREMALEAKSLAKFDATETRPVLLVGKPGAPSTA